MKMLNVLIVWKEIFKLRHFRQHFTTFDQSIWLLYADSEMEWKKPLLHRTLETGMEMWKERHFLHELQFSLKNHLIIILLLKGQNWLLSFHSPLVGGKSPICHIRMWRIVSRVQYSNIWFYYFMIPFSFIMHLTVAQLEQSNYCPIISEKWMKKTEK